MRHASIAVGCILVLCAGCAPRIGRPRACAVAGTAQLPVVVTDGASERVKAAAHQLAAMLARITGARFAVTTGDGATGIAVGVAADFPALGLARALAVKAIADREHYILRSHPAGIHVVGATDLAVEDAVWDLLHRIGYRQFFPGKTWEVVPHTPDLAIAVNADELPDYLARRIWYGYGTWDYNAEPYAQWCARNRTVLGFDLHTGHAYDALIRANKAAFDAHPEFYGLVGGKRTSSKLCIGNPALRKLIVAHALKYFEQNPDADSISMDPSDGANWCECPRCAALGSVSDRALTLANAVAEAVNQRFKSKYVGMYAYNVHSPPPSIRVHPNVIVSVATSFIRGGYTLDQLLSGWARQGTAAAFGIREYYGVNVWDRDLPGKARGTNLAYLARTIPDFHAKGARFLSAESSDSWAPCGLGYYLASRILWDTDEATRVDAIVDDFLTRAFGPAKAPMAEFYRLIDGANRPMLCDHLLGRMYRALGKAKALADTPEVKARVHHLVLYTRYVELFRDYSTARGAARQQAFEALIRHAYRMRTTMMVHTKALYRDLVRRDKHVSIPDNATWKVPEAENPWKSSAPFTDAELQRFLADGIANHAVRAFEPVAFGTDLVPAAPLKLPKVETGTTGSNGRGTQTFHTWIATLPTTIELKVTGGLIKHYRDRGPAKVDLWRTDGDNKQHIAHGETPPDGVERPIRLAARHTGLHTITVSDGHDATRVAWPEGMPMTVVSSPSHRASLHGRWRLYFYVPKGTKVVGMYNGGGSGTLLDGDGKQVLRFAGKRAGYVGVPVPPGQDGRLWKLANCTGRRLLMTVPPCLARSAAELLLPKAAVARDARR